MPIPAEGQIAHKVLLVDDDSAIRSMMTQALESKGFNVVAAATVSDALKLISTDTFDVLVTDLHMPNPGDGFTVISAMRHVQPNALTMLVSGYPDVQGAMDAIVLEADEIVVKPIAIGAFSDLVREKVLTRKLSTYRGKEGVAAILNRSIPVVIIDWLERVKEAKELSHLHLDDAARTGHLSKLLSDLVVRLKKGVGTDSGSDAIPSAAAVLHGKLRYEQGYSPAMLVHESRLLQVTVFGTLDRNLKSLDFSLLLPDVMTIADEVDAQLTQTMDSFMECSAIAAA